MRPRAPCPRSPRPHPPLPSLLAVDLGVRTGLARFGADGRLRSYRSQNYGSAERLRRAVPAILDGEAGLTHLVLEGGGPVAGAWEREAARRGLALRRVGADAWRARLLTPGERRSAHGAKHPADALARRVIEWSGAPRPTSLRHDAAEAILLGLWACLELGWLAAPPPELRRA